MEWGRTAERVRRCRAQRGGGAFSASLRETDVENPRFEEGVNGWE